MCGLGARNPFKTDGEQAAANAIVIPSCNEFERSDNIDRYVVTCPEHYAGCITQTDGQYILPIDTLLYYKILLHMGK